MRTIESVISVQGLGKKYRLGATLSSDTLREQLAAAARRLWPGNQRSASDCEGTAEQFWALRDVSFEVGQGDVKGVIGRNGAGKTTLLKILSQITEPTEGEVRVRGRVASLLEVGTGFHPELSGRENIFLNGAILGMTRQEIKDRFDEIVAFAEVEKFIDTPVKRYSSGMYVRLAFAVAAHLEPEILLVDEVLAVGDAGFQRRCLGKMGEVSREGRTVLFVSHQMDMVRSLCKSCVLLDKGGIAAQGDAADVVDAYLGGLAGPGASTEFEAPQDNVLSVQMLCGRVTDRNGAPCNRFDVFDQIVLEFIYTVRRPVEGQVVNFEVKREGSTLFMSFDSDTAPERLETRRPGLYKCTVPLPRPLLKPGRHSVSTHVGIANVSCVQKLEDVLAFEVALLSEPSALLSYAGKRPGAIAVPLSWRVERIGDAVADGIS